MTSYIFLDNLRFFAHHGVARQETLVGNEFTVSLRLQVDIRRAAETDDVANTVSYADVHEAVKAEMDIPSQTVGTCMRANHEPTVPRLPADRGNNPQAGKAQSADGRGHRDGRSGNMPTPRRMTLCRTVSFIIDTQRLPTAKTLHPFCSGAANGLQ